MTKPDNKSKPTPSDRLHAIMNGMKNEESPVSRLPKAKPVETKSVSETSPVQSPPPTAPQAESVKHGFQFLPAFWTIASIISLAVNIILLAVLTRRDCAAWMSRALGRWEPVWWADSIPTSRRWMRLISRPPFLCNPTFH